MTYWIYHSGSPECILPKIIIIIIKINWKCIFSALLSNPGLFLKTCNLLLLFITTQPLSAMFMHVFDMSCTNEYKTFYWRCWWWQLWQRPGRWRLAPKIQQGALPSYPGRPCPGLQAHLNKCKVNTFFPLYGLYFAIKILFWQSFKIRFNTSLWEKKLQTLVVKTVIIKMLISVSSY